MNYLFTSESVSEGHPDKVADQISDAILDEFLRRDPESKVACETFCSTGLVIVGGEVRSDAYVDIQGTVRSVINRIGYNKAEYMFDGGSCGILSQIHEQSQDIGRGVSRETPEDQGAGDQGMMFGYACDETPEKMPLPISLAHKLALRLTAVRKDGTLSYLRPDGKTQVTIVYEDGRPVAVDTIVISTQHNPEVSLEQIRADMIKYVIKPIVPETLSTDGMKIFVNPTGKFVIGGPQGDSGLTGRKIIVDTYGGYARHGGGAFSGKDPTKVDRSASYAARYVAKNIVAAGLADRCEIQLAYAIGVAKPVSIQIDTFGTNKIPEENIAALVNVNFDLRPAGIIKMLNLRRPIYRQTSAYGHFGRTDVEFPWERLDKVEDLRGQAGLK